ncbi:LLM class flavin-dependent oxidoreductase [Luteipulveratus mongoliensis]|uniref:Luciferase n=1 Tax=Luteipulveratus mongoliensis TaxID=571913 RepID=A0A0K1JLE1_9MICO|nr:LLM class flavin-dependent oxidoreductase [Luteipulveratus mongoliensis]AKU17531.1 luciferase [Luteipulveratus mongoliensis]
MRYGFVVPFASEVEFVELARLGEEHGWDAVFSWEGVWRRDAWVQLGAAAAHTSRIRLGTLLTPAARYKPWDLASVVSSVDQLSHGRVTLGVGLGALNSNWTVFEGEEPRAVRAKKLDECLDIYAGLTSGEPFSYAGDHYSVDLTSPVEPDGPPPPVQCPHPPVWVVGAYLPGRKRQRSLERAARWQGIFPAYVGGQEGSSGMTVEALSEIVARVRELREAEGLPWEGYDVVVEGDSHGDFGEVRGPTGPWEQAGATWWVESWWDVEDSPAGVNELRRRIAAGPPTA